MNEGCITTAALAGAAGGSQAAPARAAVPPQCPVGSICFYADEGYTGDSWEWTVKSGYSDMPGYLHDNVGSFKSNAYACFVDHDPPGGPTWCLGTTGRTTKTTSVPASTLCTPANAE